MLKPRLSTPLTAALVFLCLMMIVRPVMATEIQRIVTPKGFVAWLVEDYTLPIVAVEFAFRGGATQDPDGKEGLANLMSGLMDEGAGDLDSSSFQTRLEELSVKLSFNAGKEAFYGSFRSLTPQLDDGLDMLRLALTAPRFDAKPVERVRAQVSAQLRRRLRDPGTLAARMWFNTAFPDHPYGRPTSGTLESVAGLTSDDLSAFHRRIMARSNVVISAVGAIDAKTLAEKIDNVFGGLPENPTITPIS
jgi:zinc protease